MKNHHIGHEPWFKACEMMRRCNRYTVLCFVGDGVLCYLQRSWYHRLPVPPPPLLLLLPPAAAASSAAPDRASKHPRAATTQRPASLGGTRRRRLDDGGRHNMLVHHGGEINVLTSARVQHDMMQQSPSVCDEPDE
ncbi:Hypothetical protein SMAX5B_000152 [Scophthalmus maximus]|uniref:Uncharacterized protein n=1 Tax=Scophthalmus maximus TaxID=52904 RepID=A0A2U9D0Q9_SCOMX|nr:Hypothetical protein SMAX5B_000152 [Scophthalmus maximus]